MYSCVCVRAHAQSCLTLCDPMDCNSPGSSVRGLFPEENTGVSCHFLLQKIYPNQGSLASPAVASGFFTTKPLGKPTIQYKIKM